MSSALTASAASALEPAEPDPLPEEEELLALLSKGEPAVVADDAMRADVIRELRTAQGELRAIFFSYAVERERKYLQRA